MLILNRRTDADVVPTLIAEIAQLERQVAALLAALAERTKELDECREALSDEVERGGELATVFRAYLEQGGIR